MSQGAKLVLAGVSVVATAALSLAALGTKPEMPVREPFIVFTKDFEGFETWEHFDIPADPHPISVHEDGPRTVYLNRRPPPGSERFPVGTIIVKTIQLGDRTSWSVFAMVKRGASYNRAGAPGWEWFQLGLSDRPGDVRIHWRGTGAPDQDGGYGSGGDCNLCHMEWAAHNDAVQARELDLKKRMPEVEK
jgi:hypothetical protein